MEETYNYSTGGEIPPEMIAAYLMAAGIGLVIAIAVSIVLCILFKKNYEAIPEAYRKMEPGKVWFLLIPLFNLYWIFVVVLGLSDSYKAYFDAQGDTSVGDCARGIGLAYAICTVCSVIPCLNYVTGPAALILLIIYLVKVFGFRSRILEGGAAPAA